jgi:MoaA/NifB/PqqE/SkfB family radical SAM enzyme
VENTANHKNMSHVALNIINRCQQRCRFCFEGKREGKKELTYDEVIELIDSAAKKVPLIVFMGGEALLRKDIFDIIGYAKSKCLEVNLFTNGQQLAKPEIVEKVFASGLDALHFSFNYYNQENFAKITRVKASGWNNLINALKNINECYKNPANREFVIYFNVVVYRELADHIMDLVNLIRSHLPLWKTRFIFKNILWFPSDDGLHSSISWRAPFESLCSAFRDIGSADIDFHKLAFQGFPLCVLPEMEHLSIDLRQIVENYRIFFNFTDQKIVAGMTDLFINPMLDTYNFICKDCSLISICPGTFTRIQWPQFKPSADDLPIMNSSDPLRILRRFNLVDEQAEDLISKRSLVIRKDLCEKSEKIIRRALEPLLNNDEIRFPLDHIDISANIIHVKYQGDDFFMEASAPVSSIAPVFLCNELCLYPVRFEHIEKRKFLEAARIIVRQIMDHNFTKEEIDTISMISRKKIDSPCWFALGNIARVLNILLLPGEGEGWKFNSCYILDDRIEFAFQNAENLNVRLQLIQKQENIPCIFEGENFMIDVRNMDSIPDFIPSDFPPLIDAIRRLRQSGISMLFRKEGSVRSISLRNNISEQLSEWFRNNDNLLGYQLENITVGEDEPSVHNDKIQVMISLKKGSDKLQLWFMPIVKGDNYFLSAHRFGMRFNNNFPVDSEEKKKIAEMILDKLEQVFQFSQF